MDEFECRHFWQEQKSNETLAIEAIVNLCIEIAYCVSLINHYANIVIAFIEYISPTSIRITKQKLLPEISETNRVKNI